jgi:hypothetical protein
MEDQELAGIAEALQRTENHIFIQRLHSLFQGQVSQWWHRDYGKPCYLLQEINVKH